MIAHPDRSSWAAEQELKAQFASFDAAKAECFKEEDRERLLAVVEAGFGNFEGFNTRVRHIFQTRASFRRPTELPAAVGASRRKEQGGGSSHRADVE